MFIKLCPTKMSQKYFLISFQLFVLIALVCVIVVPTLTEGFIFWKATTTACDTCDGIDTNSGRNVACCLLQSKCCG